MTKNFFLLITTLAFFAVSCTKEKGTVSPPEDNSQVAYVSIMIKSQTDSRADSDENPGNELVEGKLNKLYLVTFNDLHNIVGVPGSTEYYSMIDVSALATELAREPEPVKISAAAKNLVVIANPGTALESVITGLSPTSTFTSFNEDISSVAVEDIMSTENGFAMITSGDESEKVVDDEIPYPYVAIGTYLKVVNGTGQVAEDAAKQAARDSRLPVTMERLTSKIQFVENETGVTVLQEDADFDLVGWTVDAVNGTYYPYAVKRIISATHTTGVYTNNFYTRDPNFNGHDGLEYGYFDLATNTTVLPFTNNDYPQGYYGWRTTATTDDQTVYVVENTMSAGEQKFANITRLVLQATYAPKDVTLGDDWFHWAGTDYKSLTELQDAYEETDAPQDLKNACNVFYQKIADYYSEAPSFTAANFMALSTADLDGVENGGDVVKDGANAVIRWYQNGQCYYYYSIRHDNSATAGNMAFAKYGVVRNNWYNLTLSSVKGPGTPWYPDINNPGPGDPDPEDPIDTQSGYLGIEVTIAPWIIWTTNIDI